MGLVCARCLFVWFFYLILVTVLWMCFSEAVCTVYLCLWWLLARLHLKWVMLKKAPFKIKRLSLFLTLSPTLSPSQKFSLEFSLFPSYDRTIFIYTNEAFLFDKCQLIKQTLLSMIPLIPGIRISTGPCWNNELCFLLSATYVNSVTQWQVCWCCDKPLL